MDYLRLLRLLVQNFRCIERMEIFPRGYTSLIGPNNSGKSSVLRAIQVVLESKAPMPEEWRKNHEDDPIVIEMDFGDCQEWEKTALPDFVCDNKICLKATYLHPGRTEERQRSTTISTLQEVDVIAGWADAWGELPEEFRELSPSVNVNARNFRGADSKRALRAAIKERYPERVSRIQNWVEGAAIPDSLLGILPQPQIIPAVKSFEDEASHTRGRAFGQLIDRALLPALQELEEHRTAMEAIRALSDKVSGSGVPRPTAIDDIEAMITRSLSGLIDAKATLGFSPPPPKSLLDGSATLQLDDGVKTRVGLQGHGLQRALVFALLEQLARHEGRRTHGQRTTLLLFEEPELYIHPHLMRRLRDNLVSISRDSSWQVIVTTHSPFLVDVATDPQSLILHRRKDRRLGPVVSQLPIDPLDADDRERLRALLDFHPTVCEAFFARQVVLVEGDTEIAVLRGQSAVHRLSGVDPSVVQETTVVSCDGKWTIIPIARLLRAFGVPLRVIHDKDQKGLHLDELQARRSHPYHANARIAEAAGTENVLVVDDTFEDVLLAQEDEARSTRDKPYRAWKRVRELCEGKENLDHVPMLRAVVGFAFAPFP